MYSFSSVTMNGIVNENSLQCCTCKLNKLIEHVESMIHGSSGKPDTVLLTVALAFGSLRLEQSQATLVLNRQSVKYNGTHTTFLSVLFLVTSSPPHCTKKESKKATEVAFPVSTNYYTHSLSNSIPKICTCP